MNQNNRTIPSDVYLMHIMFGYCKVLFSYQDNQIMQIFPMCSLRCIFVLFLQIIKYIDTCHHKNIYCGYSLQLPHGGYSSKYLQHMSFWRNKKKYLSEIFFM